MGRSSSPSAVGKSAAVSVRLTGATLAAFDRARLSGATANEEIGATLNRYDTMLWSSAPDMDPDHLHVVRAMFASQRFAQGCKGRLPFAVATPLALCGMIEDSADPKRDDERKLRTIYAAARAVAQMTPIEALAMVEACERWVRRPDSTAADTLEDEFTPTADLL